MTFDYSHLINGTQPQSQTFSVSPSTAYQSLIKHIQKLSTVITTLQSANSALTESILTITETVNHLNFTKDDI